MKLKYLIILTLILLVGCAQPEPVTEPTPEPVLQEPETTVTEVEMPEEEPEPEPEPEGPFDAVAEQAISNFSCSETSISFTLTNILTEDIYFMKLSPYETSEKRGGRLSVNGRSIDVMDLCGFDILPAGKSINCQTDLNSEIKKEMNIREGKENALIFITQGAREEKIFSC